MADQLKRIADKLDGGDPNAGTPSEKGNLRRIADALDGGDPSIGTPSEEGNLKRIADYIVENGIGGGGSGDFTTANVTVVYNYYKGTDFHAPFVLEGDAESEFPPMIDPIEECLEGVTNFKVALYKGLCWFDTGGSPVTSVSGNAEKDDDVSVLVKGDCTITIG